ncbi:unnamed protein product [Owenia fusiformis]|uniref:Lysophospholipid acyltransferase 5 n=1 Tax=Owenia fusiformis TaxID=6347 RepID=A0A8S4N2K2_OWEFU|nr:unnamed protein product [Owenia fusiformis]
MEANEADGIISFIARSIGAQENAVRLLTSLFLGYPFAFFHRQFLHGKAAILQHLYFISVGLWICYFNFGFAVIHSLANILLIYVLLVTVGGTQLSVGLALIGNMSYLLYGYLLPKDTDNYDISWTTPHCVLTLRLTSLVFDIYDGRRKQNNAKLSAEQESTALDKVPSLIEILGQTYYFGGFMVGPQFSMRRYLDFVNGEFSDKITGGPPASVKPGLSRLVLGLCYTLLFQILSVYTPDSYLTDPEFLNSTLLYKLLYILIWGRVFLFKYNGCWLITEGACLVTGLSYNGKDKNGNDLWDGCANIIPYYCEVGDTGQKLIQGFNINTNLWMAKYVFKRLKFLGNKDLSQLCTLLFLAVWHGTNSGYFINFCLEFLIIKCEREVGSVVDLNPTLHAIHTSKLTYPIIWFIKRCCILIGLGYALIGFALLDFDKWLTVYNGTYWLPFIIYLTVPIWKVPLKVIFPPVKSRQNGEQNHNTDKQSKTE